MVAGGAGEGEDVLARAAVDRAVAEVRKDVVVAGPGVDVVGAVARVDPVVAGATVEVVV